VLHFDPAADAKTHLHRSGRTGRAGADGTVLTLVLPDQAREVERMHRDAGTPTEAFDVAPRDMTVEVAVPQVAPVRRQDAPRRSYGESRGAVASGRRNSRGRGPSRRPEAAA
jgi:superfamily II DNA/RNA helicase